MKKLISLFCAVMLVCALAGCGADKTPEPVVRQFCDDLIAYDLEDAGTLMLSEEDALAPLDPETAYPPFLEYMKTRAAEVTYSIGEVLVDENGDTGTVEVLFTYPDASEIAAGAVREFLKKGLGQALAGADKDALAQLLLDILDEKLSAEEAPLAEISAVFSAVRTEKNGWKLRELPGEVYIVLTNNMLAPLEHLTK